MSLRIVVVRANDSYNKNELNNKKKKKESEKKKTNNIYMLNKQRYLKF